MALPLFEAESGGRALGSTERASRFEKARTLSSCIVFAVALMVDLSGCGGGEVGVATLPSGTSSPSPSPKPTPTPTPTQTPSPSPTSTGVIVIVVPTPAPVVCSPAPVTIHVAQQTVISCTEQGYIGPFTFTVAAPSIATVQLAPGTFTLFYVSGVSLGTTSLSLTSGSGGVGQESINVVP
jgi:hypothetical protein